MKKIALITCMFCYSLFGIAQNDALKGRVNDDLDNPVPLVHVMVFRADTFIVGTVTDTDGSFTIESLEQDSYTLKIVAIGYEDFVWEFVHEESSTDFGNLRLEASSIELDGVELIGRKKLYERRANSLVINVEQNVASSGGSVLDLLSNTAGVSVNQQNGTLSLNNRGKIAIMVNGKLSRIDGQALIGLLKSMPAANIKNLEVFNNPPAKYEANGSGGMISITTKSKSNDGQGGSISLMSGYGKGEKTGVSSNFHFQQGKIGWFGSYSFNRNRSPEDWGLESEFNNPLSQKTVVTNSFREPITNSHNYSLGIDYIVSKKTNLGGALSGYSSKWDMIAFDKVIRNDDTNGTEILDIETSEVNYWNHIAGNFYIQQSLGDGQELTFDYNYLYYHDDNPSNYEIDSQEQPNFVKIQKKTPITFNVFNLDYERQLSKSVQIEVGAKTTSSNFKNDIAVSLGEGGEVIIDDELSSSTQMDEQIHALYSSFQFQFGEKTSLSTGLRYEQTDNKLQIDGTGNMVKRKYDNLFPSLVINHQISNAHRLQFNYGRRINRPTFNHLAPFVLFLGPDALYSGNANLQPSFVHKFGAEWRWSGKYISLEYLTEKDAIVEFQPRLSTSGEQYIFKAENMDKRNMLSISVGIPFQITQWWRNDTNFIYQYQTLGFNFQGSEFNRNKRSFRVTSSQQFSLYAKTKLELGGYYQSATLFGISTFGARGAFNLGIQQQLNKNYGILKLSYNNAFASDNWKIKTNTTQPFLNTLETYYPESRIVALTYTKNFGTNKKEQKYKGGSAKEEKKRVQ